MILPEWDDRSRTLQLSRMPEDGHQSLKTDHVIIHLQLHVCVFTGAGTDGDVTRACRMCFNVISAAP